MNAWRAPGEVFDSGELVAEIGRTGTVGANCNRGTPRRARAAFVTALEVSPEWHLKMQAAIQRHVDAAVAKTINLQGGEATVAEVGAIYLAAWRAKVKGITIYRYGARPDQVFTLSLPAAVPGGGGGDSRQLQRRLRRACLRVLIRQVCLGSSSLACLGSLL